MIYKVYKPQPGDAMVKTRHGGNHVDVVESDSTKIGGNVGDAVTRRKWSLQSIMRDGTFAVTPLE